MNTCFYYFFSVEAEIIPLTTCCINFKVNASGWKAPQEVMMSNLLLGAGSALRSRPGYSGLYPDSSGKPPRPAQPLHNLWLQMIAS